MSAATMREAREFAGLSQSELGRRMADAGFPWTQTTVSRREANESTLRWNEGVALRQIIGYPEVEGDSNRDAIIEADARAYHRILAVIREREAKDFELERVLAAKKEAWAGISRLREDIAKLTKNGTITLGDKPVVHGEGNFSTAGGES